MKFLDRFSCTLTGLTLSAAGLLLLADPAWTASRLGAGLAGGILIALLALLAGIGTLCGLRRKTLSIVALVLTVGALAVCLFSGRVRLTGLCLILLPMAIYHLVYSWREGNGRVPAWFDRVALGVFALCALAIPADALINLPRIEFGPYKVGTDLRKTPLPTEAEQPLADSRPFVTLLPYGNVRACAVLVADDHIIAKTPARRANSPRFLQKLQDDPDRVMTAGILAGRLYLACLAAAFALLALACHLIRNRF